MAIDSYWQTTTPGKGSVDFRDFDEGVFSTLGAINEVEINSIKYRYFEVSGVGCDNKVKMVFSNPESKLVEQLLPFVVIRREVELNLQRLHPGHIEYMEGLGNLVNQNPDVYEEYEIREQAIPFDFNYELEINAELKSEAQKILEHFLKKIVLGYINVTDSDGDTRGYDCVDISVSTNDELNDIHNRSLGYTLSFRVMGEVNLKDAYTRKTVQSYVLNLFNKE